MNPLFRPVLAFCTLMTGVELLAIADPRLGMLFQDLLVWCIGAHFIYLGFTCFLWALFNRLKTEMASQLTVGALCALHLGIAYRMGFAVNFFMRDIRVWGVSVLILVGSVYIGLRLAPVLMRIEKWVWVLTASLLLALPFKALNFSQEDQSSLPDIVLITLDTTRPDVLGVYGSTNQTPNIDALAQKSVVFTRAISPAPLTEPAHLSMLTGRDPLQTGVVSNGTKLEDQPSFITRTLKNEGYYTGAFVSAFPLHARYGWADYFDVYDDDFGDWLGMHRLHIVQAWDQLVLPAHTLRERRGDGTVERARRWLDSEDQRPRFLWLHLFDPHAPYESPDHPFTPPTEGPELDLPKYWPPSHRAITDPDWLVEAYHAEVRYVDQLIGPLLASLEDDTIVILTADHGESLKEHQYFFEHGDNLFDPSLRIPLLLSAPGLSPQINDCLVSSMDIPSTLLGLLDIRDGMNRTGSPLQQVLKQTPCPERIQISATVAARFVENPPLSVAARNADEKLIEEETKASCYNLKTDPGEMTALEAHECPSTLDIAIDLATRGGDARSPELDAQTQEALEALGYIE